MSKQPPCLSYLTIYNPSLKPADPDVAKDDEDAEEQAQILFYTGKERAVSRDRILRQVGLAKALVNFAGMFNGSDICENTHSQSRRMIMVSPEPNFWIHACVELAKTPRQPKPKPSTNTKGKAKENAAPAQEVLYEYHDGSINDAVLRGQILNGYQDFKLLHGSFTHILTTLGQTALELQLERFFTVWAWQLDLEDRMSFGEHLGVPLHQVYQDVIPLIDRFAEQYTPGHVIFMLSPPCLLPSAALLESRYPSALTRLVLRRVPPPPPPSTNDEPVAPEPTPENAHTPSTTDTPSTDEKKPPGPEATTSKTHHSRFSSMDVRNLKWMWSGLNFGKGSSSSTKTGTPAAGSSPEPVSNAGDESGVDKAGLNAEVEIDAASLQEAIESELSSVRASPTGLCPSPLPATFDPEYTGGSEDDSSRTASESRLGLEEHRKEVVVATEDAKAEEHELVETSSPSGISDEVSFPSAESQETIESPLTARPADHGFHDAPQTARPPSEKEPRPTFLSTPVFLPETDSNELNCIHKRVFHTTKGSFTFALVADDNHDLDLDHVYDLFNDVQDALNTAHERDSQASVLTVTKILEPQDKHVVSVGEYTLSSTGFPSTSEHLFNARDILRSELDVLEVFSRGQNPQHWHIGRRGLDMNCGSKFENEPGEVYMEVARKESTLADVDNGLAGVANRYTGQ